MTAPGKHSSHDTSAGIGQTLLDDLRRGDLPRTVWRDLQDTYAFYLDDEERTRLRSMNRVRRWFNTFTWLVRALVRNMAPARRLILVVAVILFVHGTIRDDTVEVAAAFLLPFVVLLFELRDKLLARDELEVGRAVQLALLPDRNPEIDGWDIWLFTRPANDVGGDLLDYLTLDDGRLGLALGDVAGKGLGAALLMSKLQATLRAWATDATSLSDLGVRTNRILCRDGLPNRFATLTFLTIAPESGTLRLLNAGHLPPMVLRPGGLEVLPPVALPIGIMPEARFVEQEVALGQGETLLIYSDGLSEAANETDDMFGDERVMALARDLHGLSAAEAGQRLLQALAAFVGDARPADDLSLAVIRRVN